MVSILSTPSIILSRSGHGTAAAGGQARATVEELILLLLVWLETSRTVPCRAAPVVFDMFRMVRGQPAPSLKLFTPKTLVSTGVLVAGSSVFQKRGTVRRLWHSDVWGRRAARQRSSAVAHPVQRYGTVQMPCESAGNFAFSLETCRCPLSSKLTPCRGTWEGKKKGGGLSRGLCTFITQCFLWPFGEQELHNS